MPKKYCSSCGTALMPTLRLCPSCGGRSFSDQPVSIAAPTKTPKVPSAGPVNPATPSAVGRKWVAAPHGSRFMAAFIDYFLLLVATGILSIIASLAGFVGDNAPGVKLVAILAILVSIGIPYAYFTIMHASDRQASWGKSLLGLTVITLQGERLTRMQAFSRILLQSVIPLAGVVIVLISVAGFASGGSKDMESAALAAALVAVLAVSLGPHLMMFFNPQHQSLYDVLCKTCVVRRTNP